MPVLEQLRKHPFSRRGRHCEAYALRVGDDRGIDADDLSVGAPSMARCAKAQLD